MKTRLFAVLILILAVLALPACSATQDAAVRTKLGQINAAALEDLQSPQGQKLIIDAVSASAAGFVAAGTGQEGLAAADAIAGAVNAVNDASKLPSVSGSQLQSAVATAAGATASASTLATSVSNVYTAVTAKGVPPKSALGLITSGLKSAAPAK